MPRRSALRASGRVIEIFSGETGLHRGRPLARGISKSFRSGGQDIRPSADIDAEQQKRPSQHPHISRSYFSDIALYGSFLLLCVDNKDGEGQRRVSMLLIDVARANGRVRPSGSGIDGSGSAICFVCGYSTAASRADACAERIYRRLTNLDNFGRGP
jgi:hypothetical protein